MMCMTQVDVGALLSTAPEHGAVLHPGLEWVVAPGRAWRGGLHVSMGVQ